MVNESQQYSAAEMELVMKVQDVLLKAMANRITGWAAAERPCSSRFLAGSFPSLALRAQLGVPEVMDAQPFRDPRSLPVFRPRGSLSCAPRQSSAFHSVR